jgi:DNA-binding transcriptional ArsR family regulator
MRQREARRHGRDEHAEDLFVGLTDARQVNPHTTPSDNGENVVMARPLVHVGVNMNDARGSFDAERMVMDDFKKTVTLARAIAVPTRLALLQTIGETGTTLSDAAATVGISPATAHHHLDVLVRAGLATKTARGRTAIYRWSKSRWAFTRLPPPAPTMPSTAAEGT